MGQKVNPIVFRLGNSGPNFSEWHTNQNTYSHLLSQDLEIRNFISCLLRSNGILLRSCKIQRSFSKMKVYLDFYFSYSLSKQAKFFWARSLFKSIKKKYVKINKIKDIKNLSKFLDFRGDLQNKQEISIDKAIKKKYVVLHNKLSRRKNFFRTITKRISSKALLSYKNRLFFFLTSRRNSETGLDNNVVGVLKKPTRSHYKNLAFVRLSVLKLRRLFVLKKFKYNFRNYNLLNQIPNDLTKQTFFDLLNLNKSLCKSLQYFCGVEEVQVNIFSNQLNYLPSFKLYQRRIYSDLVVFQRNKDLYTYFVETLESLYFIFVCFGYGNAYLLSCFLTFLLENTRKQIFVTKFIQKSLNVLFNVLPPESLAIDGIKILIKGRFNKRRRTKKIVLQEGQISLQTINTPIDYYQTQAITIYGSFGIKVWISKRQT